MVRITQEEAGQHLTPRRPSVTPPGDVAHKFAETDALGGEGQCADTLTARGEQFAMFLFFVSPASNSFESAWHRLTSRGKTH